VQRPRPAASNFPAAAAAAAAAPPPRRPSPPPDAYRALRAEQFELQRAAREERQLGRAANLRGDKTAAFRHSRAAAELEEAAVEAAEKAKQNTLAVANAEILNVYTTDLHMLHVPEALAEVDKFLTVFSQNHSGAPMQLAFITGRGQHSGDGGAKIQPAVLARLDELGTPWTLDAKSKGGIVVVTLDDAARASVRDWAGKRARG